MTYRTPNQSITDHSQRAAPSLSRPFYWATWALTRRRRHSLCTPIWTSSLRARRYGSVMRTRSDIGLYPRFSPGLKLITPDIGCSSKSGARYWNGCIINAENLSPSCMKPAWNAKLFRTVTFSLFFLLKYDLELYSYAPVRCFKEFRMLGGSSQPFFMWPIHDITTAYCNDNSHNTI